MGLLLDFIIVGLSIGIVYGLVALGISLIYSGARHRATSRTARCT